MRLIPSDPDIATVVGRIRDGSLDLQPDFQRGAVWPKQKQRLLVDSVLRNWYVPPIHVVRTESEEQIVLDGQQRLRAIFEFVTERLTVDGRAEPASQEIKALDGLRYSEIPEQVRRRFDRFTLRIFEVIDYEPEEPYELFYRLNQPTTLTSAEKRNAFFGTPREQVRELTEVAEHAGMTPGRVGFPNSRLAYEDILARFVWTLEVGTLAEGVSASKLTARYRSGEPFSRDVMAWAEESAAVLFGLPSLDDPRVRLNKATAHSWLCFVARGLRMSNWQLDDEFVSSVERRRARHRRPHVEEMSDDVSSRDDGLIALLNDRATSRVNDVTSVVLRDAILWILYARTHPSLSLPRVSHLVAAADHGVSYYQVQDSILSAADDAEWERLR
jgi:hypothetical protein